MIIAIDGTAAAGKSTLARRIAAHYGLPHLDTGSLYRAVARDVIKAGHALTDVEAAAEAARNLDAATLSDPDLRLKGNGEAASIVAVYPEVRAELIVFQRSFAANPKGAVSRAAISEPSSAPMRMRKSSLPRAPKAGPSAAISSLRGMASRRRKRSCCGK